MTAVGQSCGAWSQQGPAQEEPQGEIPPRFIIWTLQTGPYSHKPSAQCSSAHTSQQLQSLLMHVTHSFLPLLFLILNSLRKKK